MGLDRLGHMSLLAFESDVLDSISNNDVIDYFASLKLLTLIINKLIDYRNSVLFIKNLF